MKKENSQSKLWARIKIIVAVLAFFCLAMPAQSFAANGGEMNFFERATEKIVETINQAAAGAQAIVAGLGEGASVAANGLQNRIYSLADSGIITAARNGINSTSGVVANLGQASLSSVWGQITCFFGFGCAEKKTAENTKTETIQTQIQAETGKGLTFVATEDRPLDTINTNQGEAQNQELESFGDNRTQIGDVPSQEIQSKATKTVTIIQPTKEIQTIHTVTNNTETVVADEDLRAKVNQLIWQLDSDRPSFSLGQSYTLPSGLTARTLGIGNNSSYNDFTVDKDGNVNAQTITVAGNVAVQGNFTVSGAQTFSGATALNAATAGPLLAIDQTGAGAALRADNLMFKESTIFTEDTDSAILLNPNGTGAVQFNTTGNYIDSNGNLVLTGGITSNSLNVQGSNGANAGIEFSNAIPGATSMKLYNDSGVLMWNGAALAMGSSVSGTIGYLPKFTAANALGNSTIFESGGNVGIGTNIPSAILHLKAGTAVAGTAPFKLSGGVNLVAPEVGAMEFDGTNLYFTPSAARKTVAFIDSNVATATALQNSRTINGVSFDGTGNIVVTADAGTLSGTTLNSTVVSSSLTSVGTLANLTVTNPITGSVTGSSGFTTGNAATVTNGVYTNAANSFSLINPITTLAESWIGPSSTAGIYFKNNNVGIGTTGPAARLHVLGSDSLATTTVANFSGATGTGLVVMADRKVGIGKTAPVYALDVAGAINTDSYLRANGAVVSTTNGLYYSLSTKGKYGFGTATTGTGAYPLTLYSGDAATYTDGYINFNTAGLERMRIDSSGNVGIGTTAPAARLEVRNDDGAEIMIHAINGGGADTDLRLKTNYRDWKINVGDVDPKDGLTIFDGTNARMFIDDSGNVGIGTTGPGSSLEVTGGIRARGGAPGLNGVNNNGYAFNGGSGDIDGGMFSSADGIVDIYGNNQKLVTFDGDGTIGTYFNYGNVGIGTTMPSGIFEVFPAGATRTAGALRIIDKDVTVGILSGTSGDNSNFSVVNRSGGNILNANGTYYTVGISGAAIQGTGLNIASLNFAGAGLTNAYGLQVNAPTGATNNYAAIFSTGNVGIGTTGPGAKLSVLGSDSLATTTVANLSGSTGTGLVVMADGKVGIGTTAPINPLQINHTGNSFGALTMGDYSNSANSTGIYLRTTAGYGYINTAVGGQIFIGTGGVGTVTNGIKIDSTGNVGIGTTGPTEKLDISGGGIIVRGANNYTTNQEGLYLGYGASTSNIWSLQPNGAGYKDLLVRANSTTIKSGENVIWYGSSTGNVGIGTTGPTRGRLEILQSADANASGLAVTGTSGGNVRLWIDSNSKVRIDGSSTGGNPILLNGEGSGNVGIGTTSPGTALDVNGNVTAIRYITGGYNLSSAIGLYANTVDLPVIAGANTNATANILFSTNNAGTAAERMRISSTGNVGIGTTGPETRLHLKASNTGYAGGLLLEESASSNEFAITSAGSKLWIGSGTTADIANSVTRMVIQNDGNVGIGTTSPTFPSGIKGLHIAGSAVGVGTVLGTSNSDNSRFLELYSGHSTDNNPSIIYPSSYDLRIGTWTDMVGSAYSEKMRITSGGNVGIGTASPGTRFDVVGAGITSATAAMNIMNASSTSALYVRNDGNVGIGTTGPNQKFEIGANGGIGFSGTSPYLGSSDKKLYSPVDGDLEWMTANAATGHGFAVSSAGARTVYLNTNGNSYLNGGKVGIGTTVPGQKLEVSGGGIHVVGTAANPAVNSGQGLEIGGGATPYIQAYDRNASAYLPLITVGSYQAFQISGSEKMRIDSSGNVGIGTTSPVYPLDVVTTVNGGGIRIQGATDNNALRLESSASGGRSFYLASTGGTSGWGQGRLAFVDSTAGAARIVIDPNGNVGIGTTGPGAKLETIATQGVINTTVRQLGLVNIYDDTAYAADVGAALTLGGKYNANGEYAVFGAIKSGKSIATSSFADGYLSFYTTPSSGVLSERVRINSAGNVGIGTTGPLELLHVKDVSNNALMGVQSGVNSFWAMEAVNVTNRLDIGAYSGTHAVSPYLTILDGGNIGIGTTSPGAKLQIGAGSVSATPLVRGLMLRGDWSASSVRHQNYLSFIATTVVQDNPFDDTTAESEKNWHIGITSDSGYFGTPRFSFLHAGVEKMVILDNGNVGIGTTAPSTKLEVAGSSAAAGDNNGILKLSVGTWQWQTGIVSGTGGYAWQQVTEVGATNNRPLVLQPSDGNVGIGTTAPASNLDIVGATGINIGVAASAARLNIYSDTSENYFSNLLGNNIRLTTTSGIFEMLNTGNVGIGTTGPSQKLEVNGKIKVDDLTTAGGADVLYSVGGVLTTVASSHRFKENIRGYENVLSRINELQPVHFQWKADTATPGREDFGFIAEDAAVLFPELATYEEDGVTIRGFKYDKLPILLTKAIQEQQKEIDDLRLVLGPAGTISNASSTLESAQGSNLLDWLVNGLNSLDLALKDGVASLKGVVVDSFTAKQAAIEHIQNDQITTNQISANQMCVKDSGNNDICLTGDQLKDLIQKAGASMTMVKTYAPTDGGDNATDTTTAGNEVIETPSDNGINPQGIESTGKEAATTTEEIIE